MASDRCCICSTEDWERPSFDEDGLVFHEDCVARLERDQCFICLKEEWGLPVFADNGLGFHEECAVKVADKDSKVLGRVCVTIAQDGFMIDGRFHCRKLGWANRRNESGNVKFTMPCRFSDLKDDNKRNVKYVAKRIIGLSFDDGPRESPFGLECLSGMVQTIYLQSKSKEWDCVAYKGGHFERDLLESLGIPAINLEDFGCPEVQGIDRNWVRSDKDMWTAHRGKRYSLCYRRMLCIHEVVQTKSPWACVQFWIIHID